MKFLISTSPSNNGAEPKSNVTPEKCPAIEVNLSKSDIARASKKERQLQNKLRKQKGLSKSENSRKGKNNSDLSEDSFTSIDDSGQSCQYDFVSPSKFFQHSPVSSSKVKQSSKRPNSDDESERRTRSKSNDFRKGTLLISKVPLVK